jgi:hypothetical protein
MDGGKSRNGIGMEQRDGDAGGGGEWRADRRNYKTLSHDEQTESNYNFLK